MPFVTGAILPGGVHVEEDAEFLYICVITRVDVHRLCFPHPSQMMGQSSVFCEVNLNSFHRNNLHMRSQKIEGLSYTAGSWATASVGCTALSNGVFRSFSLSGGIFVFDDLRNVSMIGALWRNITARAESRIDAVSSFVDRVGGVDEAYFVTFDTDYMLKFWCVSTRSCVFARQVDCGGAPAGPIAPGDSQCKLVSLCWPKEGQNSKIAVLLSGHNPGNPVVQLFTGTSSNYNISISDEPKTIQPPAGSPQVSMTGTSDESVICAWDDGSITKHDLFGENQVFSCLSFAFSLFSNTKPPLRSRRFASSLHLTSMPCTWRRI